MNLFILVKVGGIMEATTNFQPNVEVVLDPEVLARRSSEIFIAEAIVCLISGSFGLGARL